ncbi:MAG: glycosyltransferase family 4 protein, partial [Nitrososphaerota archaeon]
IDKSKIKIIPNGVIVEQNPPQLFQKEDIFCFIGIICERKRVYESIKYFIDNYSIYKTTKMYVVGPYHKTFENREMDEEYVNKCFQLIHQYGLEDRIIFTGLLDKSKVIEILKKSKALIFFSNREGMPNAVLEAMANNCVPITTEIGGVAREIFEDGKHGFILDENFKKIEISSIDELIEKKAPYNRVKEIFDINTIAQIYNQIYE